MVSQNTNAYGELESLQLNLSVADDDDVTQNVTPCTSPTNDSDCDSVASGEGLCREGLNAYDVVCGRDKLSHSHPGNKRFRRIIQSYREKYQTASRREDKTRITGEIVALVEHSGGRFLKSDENGKVGEWSEVDPASIHEKVSHALRSARDPSQTKAKRKRSGDALQYPTPDENSTFKRLLSAQKSVFLTLLDKHCDEDAVKRVQLNPLFVNSSLGDAAFCFGETNTSTDIKAQV